MVETGGASERVSNEGVRAALKSRGAQVGGNYSARKSVGNKAQAVWPVCLVALRRRSLEGVEALRILHWGRACYELYSLW